MVSDNGSTSSSEQDLEDEWFSIASSVADKAEDTESGTQDSLRSSTPDQELPSPVTMTARAYQLEMLEESLKQNIIVAVCLISKP